MTRAWKVGERCWAEGRTWGSVAVFTVAAVSDTSVALKDESGMLHVGKAHEISKSRREVDIVILERALERQADFEKAEMDDLVGAREQLARTRKRTAEMKKHLAALRAKGGRK